ncbi:uncharacterized protein LOC122034739 [Zingiber officinale]|uniref:Late embryogenesis abundant protein LEA-2 subgroup domain-containing protein n=1 Tax=Zingiber officinale TaxID=94328 RepID=A0A8J5ETP7_ZINOF|nr:uncharacterized protein LOC122034739 [Zingiber officinale]KAG6468612.1 hypothetical protein ZIOFF_073301 [Zingiber officinale]
MAEEQEALFQAASPCVLYYVQSPSSASHTNSSTHPATSSSAFHLSPSFSAHDNDVDAVRATDAVADSRFALSRYSSSRGSNNSASFLHHQPKKAAGAANKTAGRQRLRIVGVNDDDADEGTEGGRNSSGLWRFLSLDPSSSCCCLGFQVAWRLALSLAFSFLVFFLATKPPQPNVSLEIATIKQFSLREGLDSTGVVTKLLTCNCSMEVVVENHSKVFRLHIQPYTMDIAFESLVFASSQSDGTLCAESGSSSTSVLFLGTKSKPMYGAGRSMQDMLESGEGLPLLVRVKLRSSYRVILGLVRSNYQHHAECRLLLNGAYDEHGNGTIYNSTCFISTSHA